MTLEDPLDKDETIVRFLGGFCFCNHLPLDVIASLQKRPMQERRVLRHSDPLVISIGNKNDGPISLLDG